MKNNADFEVVDDRRRLVIKGVTAAVTAALLGTACSRSVETDVPSPKPFAEPPVPTDDSVPPGTTALSAESESAARAILDQVISVDVHCHPGMFFFNGMEIPDDPLLGKMASIAGFEARTIADMNAGGLSAALFATVADIKLIGASETAGLFARREFEPGEAYADHMRQMSVLKSIVESEAATAALSVADIISAKERGQVAAILTTEGADFLEKKGERIEEAYADGIRCIGLVHYHVNDIGDIQTAAPVHGGLTDFGKEAVKEMNRLGILIDLAHARFETARDAAELSSKPVMVSHSFIANADAPHPRLLSIEHAKVIAATGGLVGAWPAGIGSADFPAFVDKLCRLVDVIGIDHVGLGTDMDANYKPVFSNYRQLPHLPLELRKRGMSDAEISQVLGGNFLRVFAEVTNDV